MNEISSKISVVVPVYNSEKTIERAINSILMQSVPVLEVLIFDDESSDRSWEVISNLARTDKRIRCFQGVGNRGAGFARGFLLKQVTGDFVAFLDADDEWCQSKLKDQMPAFTNSSVGISATGFRVFDGDIEAEYRSVPANISMRKMHLSNWIGMSTAIVRMSLEGSRSMPQIRKRQDYGYWLKLFKLNPDMIFCGINEPHVNYFRSGSSLSSNKIDNVMWNFKVFREILRYNIVFSVLCTSANIIFRLLKYPAIK